jgi:cyclic pyranopterin monophosphate synthase
MNLTHLDEQGNVSMVDVGQKDDTLRVAIAGGKIFMLPQTLALISSGQAAKGNVLATATIAGIMAAKKTAELIPLCHSIPLTHIELEFEQLSPASEKGLAAIEIKATAKSTGKTGVEMEALTAVAVAGLTIYDMCKAVDRAMRITDIRLLFKSGGKSGVTILDERLKDEASREG